MDKRQQLEEVIKKAGLPAEVEKLLMEELGKQTEVTDDFVLTMADTLERLGIYMQTVGEIQNEYLDSVLEEARKVNGAVNVLDSIASQLEENMDQQVQVQSDTQTQPVPTNTTVPAYSEQPLASSAPIVPPVAPTV
jgi:hypothetical protein